MAVDPMVEYDHLVTDLRGAVHNGESGLAYVPRLLKRLLKEGAWRERYDVKSRTVVSFRSFAEFVTTPATQGLGASVALIERIVGTDDAELLILLREARVGTPGRPRKGQKKPLESNGFSSQGEGSDYTAERLSREAPDQFAAVQRGELTIHAAAVAAGIRKRRIPLRLDDAESALRSLRTNASPEFWEEFKRLVTEA